MRALPISFGATVFACNIGGCAQGSLGTTLPSFPSFPTSPSFGASLPYAQLPLASNLPHFPSNFAPQPSFPLGGGFTSQLGAFNSQPYQGNSLPFSSGPFGGGSVIGAGSFVGGSSFDAHSYIDQGSLLDVTYNTGSPFSANKPWQAVDHDAQGSVPTSWQNSPSSVWTSAQPSQQGQASARVQTPAIPRPVNPSLAGRKPGEQLQITKCRSAQSCEKCRQLNCYWDSTGRIASRCIALGLEASNIPVEAGQASNLGYCPAQGQQGFFGVNWLAIENSGAAVPNLEGMSDTSIQQWISSIPNYDPDSTSSNYPAGTAFQDLLPSAARAYADGKIPSTTPWISFFDSLSAGYSYDGGYSYDSYSYDSATYDVSYPNFAGATNFGSFGSNLGVGVGAPSLIGSSFSNTGCGSCGR